MTCITGVSRVVCECVCVCACVVVFLSACWVTLVCELVHELAGSVNTACSWRAVFSVLWRRAGGNNVLLGRPGTGRYVWQRVWPRKCACGILAENGLALFAPRLFIRAPSKCAVCSRTNDNGCGSTTNHDKLTVFSCHLGGELLFCCSVIGMFITIHQLSNSTLAAWRWT